MSVKKGTTEIGSIKKGDIEIGQAYLGDKLVFDHDSPVWMIRTALHWMISTDGLNIIKTENTSYNSTWHTPCVGTLGFGFTSESSGSTKNKAPVHWYNIKKLRDKQFSSVTYNIWTSDVAWGTLAIASNGANLVVAISYKTGSLDDGYPITYSTNGGTSWTKVACDVSLLGVRYIGNNEFYLHNNSTSGTFNTRGYHYFDGNSKTIKSRTFTISATTNFEVANLWICENGRVFVYVYSTVSKVSGMYTANGKSGALTKIGKTELGYFTYIYDKYYAIGNSTELNDSEDLAGRKTSGTGTTLWVSTNGTTWTSVANYFPGNVRQIEKNNGRLQVLGVNFFGYIDENQQLHYTTFTNQGNSDWVAGFVCNKFHKF